eukprot:maker-scaffold87_size395581-snap-gene-1.13 protein:Tk12239 transcript:maker-scaffold87_size395581-snap-gene-1.13-mRNA-1 annotation:"t family of potassium channels protein 7 isoform x4"
MDDPNGGTTYNRYSDQDLPAHQHPVALSPRVPGDWYELGSLSPHQTHQQPYYPNPHQLPLGPKTHWQKFKDLLRSVLAFVFSNVGIIVLVVLYLFMGAAVFEEIEGPGEVGVEFFVTKYRNQTVQRLWDITYRYNTLHKANWTTDVKVIVDEFYGHILEQVGEGYSGADIPAPKWTFSGALLYSITVITTIGYGHIAPSTMGGKIFSMFYAIVGMPLFLLYLSNIGNILATSFKWTYSRCCQFRNQRQKPAAHRHYHPPPAQAYSEAPSRHEDLLEVEYMSEDPQYQFQVAEGGEGSHSQRSARASSLSLSGSSSISGQEIVALPDPGSDGFSNRSVRDSEEELYMDQFDLLDMDDKDPNDLHNVTVPILLSITVMVSYICGGAVLFSGWEGWSILNGSYFCFITLSTIGFGDFVPGASLGDSSSSDGESGLSGLINLQFMFCSMYILLGMAVIAMCFNLMQEKVVVGVTSLGKKLGIIKDE